MSAAPDILARLRDLDRERYISVLFAPEPARPALAALHAFAAETARVRDMVSEPLPGEIRLQWWRDVLDGERAGEGAANPVSAALMTAIEAFNLPRASLMALLEAQIFDLYDDPMPSRADLEGYLGETVSAVFQLAAQVLNGGAAAPSADAAGHGGVAYGIAGMLRRTVHHHARGQVYMPGDVLAATGLDAARWLSDERTPAHDAAVQALVALGREHLARASEARRALPAGLRSPFVLLAVCEPVFAKAERLGGKVRFEPPQISPVTAQWRMTRAAVTGY